jgi:cyclopropane fatty-acyl-phospholipid synthase-like methyltransferase
VSYESATHYDRVTGAWSLLLGEELHYGVFSDPSQDLASATRALTQAMIEAAEIDPGMEVLDIGCGTGAPACALAAELGARVTGITTSAEGVEAARARAAAAGLESSVSFEQRDGMDNGFAEASFDRTWVLESSHLMRERGRLIAECARVLRPGGRLALCDIVLRRRLDLLEVKRLREPLMLLREVFGDARMEPLAHYAHLALDRGLVVEQQTDLTEATRPTFARWRENADRNRDEVVALLGEPGWHRFRDACDVLEGFWDDGTLGYGLLAATKR